MKLKALAWRRKFPEAQGLISHLGSCSPCYQEHEEFVRQHRSRQRLYRLAAVAVLVVGLSFWISWKLMRGPGSILHVPQPIVNAPPPEQPPIQGPVPPELEQQKPPEVQVAVLDLRKRGIPRGESKKTPGAVSYTHLTLPTNREV